MVGVSHRRLLSWMLGDFWLVAALLLAAFVQQGHGDILGARMTWEVNPLFEGDTVASVRTVALSLTTAWPFNPSCGAVSPGKAVPGCPIASGSAADTIKGNFGELCWHHCKNNPSFNNVVCGAKQCTPNALVAQYSPTDPGELSESTSYFQGILTYQVTIPPANNLLVAYLSWAESSTPKFRYTNAGKSEYWNIFPDSTALFATDVYPIVPTVVPLCTSVPENDGTDASCPRGKLRNYYSPKPMLPLIVSAPTNAAMLVGTNIKTVDHDGHMLELQQVVTATATEPTFASDTRVTSISSVFLDIDDPVLPDGPKIFFDSTAATKLVRVEVSDRTYVTLEPLSLVTSFSAFSKWSDEQTSVQAATTVLKVPTGRCSATNPPPEFVKEAGSTDANYLTEYSCSWKSGTPGVPSCQIPLHARSVLPADQSVPPSWKRYIKIKHAFGFPSMDANAFTCLQNSFACGCPLAGAKSCSFVPASTPESSSGVNHFNLGNPWQATDIGKVFVSCFVATSERRTIDTDDLVEGPCPSLPTCVRVRITGTKPRFMDPTPLAANSRDSVGTLVPGRTDVGACLGYPLQLNLKAIDDDGDKVRIFLTDIETGTNFDFFQSKVQDSITVDECGTFHGYSAQRKGDNSNQTFPYILDFPGAQLPKVSKNSVMAKIGPSVTYTQGTASQYLQYQLDVDLENGITERPRSNNIGTNYRQQILNKDKMLCGAAFDDSRTRYKRWVGERVGASRPYKWRRDSANAMGDLASNMHCWMIRMQAPPRFLTDQSKGCRTIAGQEVTYECTPFGGEESSDPTTDSTTGNVAAYKTISVGSSQLLTLTFLAGDPNPGDMVTLFVLEDPGLPDGMIVGRSKCVDNTDDFICAMADKVAPGYPNQNFTVDFKSVGSSLCQRATLQLSWKPRDKDVGQSFRVCMVARDNSDLCYGQGVPDATSRGWFGEKQCVDISVKHPEMSYIIPAPVDEFAQSTSRPVTSFGRHEAFVGCSFSFDVSVSDSTLLYNADIAVSGDVPSVYAFAEVPNECPAGPHCRKMFTWSPKRGSEGEERRVCFGATSASDSIPAKLGHCSLPSSGNLHAACDSDSECIPGMGRCVPSCITMVVQRCRYCVSKGNTLQAVLSGSALGVNTNWLRLWMLNAEEQVVPGPTCRFNGTARVCQMESDVVSGKHATIDNPDVVLQGDDKFAIWAGALYSPGVADTLQSISAQFQTSIKELLSMNPHLGGDPQALLGPEICTSPCSSTGHSV